MYWTFIFRWILNFQKRWSSRPNSMYRLRTRQFSNYIDTHRLERLIYECLFIYIYIDISVDFYGGRKTGQKPFEARKTLRMEYFGSYYSDWPCLNSELGGWQNRYSTRSVGAFDVCVVVFLATAIFLASVHGKCFTIYCRCWCHFYEVQQSIVNFGTWTINQSALWQLKKTRKIKTASCQNGGCGTRKLVKLDLSLEYPGWVSILCQRWTDLIVLPTH